MAVIKLFKSSGGDWSESSASNASSSCSGVWGKSRLFAANNAEALEIGFAAAFDLNVVKEWRGFLIAMLMRSKQPGSQEGTHY